MSNRTLVVHSGGIGDFICTLPALEKLAQDGPVEIAGIPERAALAKAAGIAVAVHDLHSIDFGSIFASPSTRLIQFLEPFDRAFVWMKDDDGTIARNLAHLGLDDVRCFPGIPSDDWENSAARYYADGVGAKIEIPFRLAIAPHGAAHDVIIQPGSGSVKKNWGMDRFHTVARKLEEQGRSITWCYGPAEEAFLRTPNTLVPDAGKASKKNKKILKPRGPRTINLGCAPATLPPMPLVDLAAVLSNTRLFIGNDSGISHLASVVGCPTVVIFGPTNPKVWQPIGPHTCVLQGAPWPTISELLDRVSDLP